MKTLLRPQTIVKRPDRLRILIVGKEDSALLSCRRSLRKRFNVSAARDGLACVAQLRDCVPHVVVLDDEILWGGAAGVIAVMREDPAFSMVPVVLLTVLQDPKHLDLVATFIQLLPCSADQLSLRIREAAAT